jgi:hypothetical protein
VNDALALYFVDVTIASAFVAHWCAAQRVEIVDGVYRVREANRRRETRCSNAHLCEIDGLLNPFRRVPTFCPEGAVRRAIRIP